MFLKGTFNVSLEDKPHENSSKYNRKSVDVDETIEKTASGVDERKSVEEVKEKP